VIITKVDGKKFKLVEPYLNKVKETRPFGPVKVPAGEYFAMGDNRTESGDSRYGLGTIKFREIIGKAFVKIWPPGRWGRLGSVTYPGDYPGDLLPTAGLVLVFGARRWRRRARMLTVGEPAEGEAA